jgi:MFS family permease
MNKAIKILVRSDLIMFGALGLITPFFAVFITNQIQGGSIEVIGFAAGIYAILKSLLQIPIGKFLDKIKGEKDDFCFLILGYLIVALLPIGYIFSCLPWHIYILQAIYAVGMAMAYPSWFAIFTRHIDKGKEAFEWSIWSTNIDLGVGVAGIAGGILVTKFNFNFIFILASVLACISVLGLFIIKKYILSKKSAN